MANTPIFDQERQDAMFNEARGQITEANSMLNNIASRLFNIVVGEETANLAAGSFPDGGPPISFYQDYQTGTGPLFRGGSDNGGEGPAGPATPRTLTGADLSEVLGGLSSSGQAMLRGEIMERLDPERLDLVLPNIFSPELLGQARQLLNLATPNELNNLRMSATDDVIEIDITGENTRSQFARAINAISQGRRTLLLNGLREGIRAGSDFAADTASAATGIPQAATRPAARALGTMLFNQLQAAQVPLMGMLAGAAGAARSGMRDHPKIAASIGASLLAGGGILYSSLNQGVELIEDVEAREEAGEIRLTPEDKEDIKTFRGVLADINKVGQALGPQINNVDNALAASMMKFYSGPNVAERAAQVPVIQKLILAKHYQLIQYEATLPNNKRAIQGRPPPLSRPKYGGKGMRVQSDWRGVIT